jgi:hypothetical protein
MEGRYAAVGEGSGVANLNIQRFGAIPGLIISSAICYTLLGLHLTNWRGSENALMWTKANSTSVTIIVQILSHALGLIYVQVICTYLHVQSTKSRVDSKRSCLTD